MAQIAFDGKILGNQRSPWIDDGVDIFFLLVDTVSWPSHTCTTWPPRLQGTQDLLSGKLKGPPLTSSELEAQIRVA